MESSLLSASPPPERVGHDHPKGRLWMTGFSRWSLAGVQRGHGDHARWLGRRLRDRVAHGPLTGPRITSASYPTADQCFPSWQASLIATSSRPVLFSSRSTCRCPGLVEDLAQVRIAHAFPEE
jgi:hypothetical protein